MSSVLTSGFWYTALEPRMHKEFSIACGVSYNAIFRSCPYNFCPWLSENLYFRNFWPPDKV